MKYQVDVSWTMLGGQLVEAETEEEARAIAEEMPLSSFNGNFLSDSFTIDYLEQRNLAGEEQCRDEKRGRLPAG